MPNLYVILDENGNVIEASIQQLDGSIQVEATQEQINEIMFARKDAVVENGVVTQTTEGDDYFANLAFINAQNNNA